MGRLVPYLIAGIALVLVLDHFSVFPRVEPSPRGFKSDVVTFLRDADHSTKGNRLPIIVRENSRTRIVAVEIVGLQDTAIVYRDREGRILFRNDPLTNTTVVAKNVTLPEVTIRDNDSIAVRPAPVGAPAKTKPPKLRMGCDPSFGPLADPSVRGLSGRCLTTNSGVRAFASIW
jgi:hypothetical protein